MNKISITFYVLLALSLVVLANNSQKYESFKFVEPKIQKVDFEDKLLTAANNTYNQELLKARKQYEKVVTDYRKEYFRVLKKNLATNKDEKDKIQAEINRIKVEMSGGFTNLRNESGKFAYNKVLTYKLLPTDQWIKISDLKKGDKVTLEIKGMASKDITKARKTDWSSRDVGGGAGVARPHYIYLRLHTVLIRLMGPNINSVTTKKGLYQGIYTVETDGPLFIGYRYDATKFDMKPHINGRGHLDITVKVTRK